MKLVARYDAGGMHIETLKSFCDLVETGSFSKAATLNFVSQSAISQQVRMLEERYGQPLIERGHRRHAVPTEAGKILYDECRALLERFRVMEERVRHQSAIIAGTIRIATVYSIGLHELPPYTRKFIKAHPQVKVHVEYSRTDKVYEACQNNSIDFGIVALPLRRPNLTILPFREDKLVLVCSPEHPLAARRRVSLKKLSGADFIAFERDIPTRRTIDRLLREHGVAVSYVMEFDNIETIKRSVEVGVGLSILPANTITNEVRNGLLVALEFSEGTFTRPVGIIHRKGKVLSAAAQEFIRQLTAGS